MLIELSYLSHDQSLASPCEVRFRKRGGVRFRDRVGVRLKHTMFSMYDEITFY